MNLQSTFSASFLDIISTPSSSPSSPHATLQTHLASHLRAHGATPSNLNAFRATAPWAPLRSAVFESIRLAGPATGPARMVVAAGGGKKAGDGDEGEVALKSDPARRLPAGAVVTLSSMLTQRSIAAWGADAERYRWDRFLAGAGATTTETTTDGDPPIGSASWVIWGLAGPHLCPGRWFALAIIQLMVAALLERYEFEPETVLPEEDRFVYGGGCAFRTEFGVVVRPREGEATEGKE